MERPKTAFIFFLKDYYDEIKNDNVNLTLTDISIIADNTWKNLNMDIKTKYMKIEEIKKELYYKKLKILNELLQYINVKSNQFNILYNHTIIDNIIRITLEKDDIFALIKISENTFYYKIYYQFEINNDDYIENMILFEDFEQIIYLIDDVINSIIPPSIDY